MESFQRGPFFFSFFLYPGQIPCCSSPPTPESITRSKLLGPPEEPKWGSRTQPRPELGAASWARAMGWPSGAGQGAGHTLHTHGAS